VRPAKLDWVRNEITRMRGQLSAQEREIRMLRRAGMSIDGIRRASAIANAGEG
jgi:hypothetical protein